MCSLDSFIILGMTLSLSTFLGILTEGKGMSVAITEYPQHLE